MEKKVDIIVPIWESYEYLVECVRSVRENTQEDSYRLVFINDASNDRRIEKFILSNKDPEDIYISSPENLGFVKSVNKGLSIESNNDVVLLNTDTVVTKNWLKSLQEAVYSEPKIAAGNPVSNNASMYSIESLKVLKETEYKRIQEIGEIISTKVEVLLTKIPTAVGCCMYIKREVLDEIGILDEIYGRGYGEENDWSMRARNKGYEIILTGNAFIYHKGSVSMIKAGDIKPGELTKMENERILEKRYPSYIDNVEEFRDSGIISHWEQLISLAISGEIQQRRPKHNILYYLHNSLSGVIVGGTELHVNDLIEGLQNYYNSCLAYINNHTLFIDYYCEGIKTSYIFPLTSTVGKYDLYNKQLEEKFEYVLKLLDIRVTHIHHLMYGGLSLGKACKSFKTPVILTLHDYYTLSPDYNLLHDYVYGLREEKKVKGYFKEKYDLDNFELIEWRAKMSEFINLYVDSIIVPSESARNIFVERFKNLKSDEIKVIPHGYTGKIDNKFFTHSDGDGVFRVGFIGATDSVSKGRNIILDMRKSLTKSGIEMHFFGIKTDSKIGQVIGKDKKVFIHGYYMRDNIVKNLEEAKIDLVVLPSVWPETYGYTLTEAWMAGIPVIVSSLGALAERVKVNGGGVIAETLSPSVFAEEVKALRFDSDRLEKYVQEINKINFISLSEMSNQYSEMYSRMIGDTCECGTNKFIQAERSLNIYGNPREMKKKYRSLERTYLMLIGGRLWQFLDRTYYKIRNLFSRN